MSFYIWQQLSDSSVTSKRRVFRANELNSDRTLDLLCVMLLAQANEQATQLDAAHEQARALGHEQGFAEGQAQARERSAANLVSLHKQLDSVRDELQAQVGQLALAVAQKLLGQFSDADRLAGLADTAAREMVSHAQPNSSVKVFVHPKHLDEVRARLDAGDRQGSPLQLIVQADPHCGEQSCRLESELGAIDASLPVQMDQLAQAWGVK